MKAPIILIFILLGTNMLAQQIAQDTVKKSTIITKKWYESIHLFLLRALSPLHISHLDFVKSLRFYKNPVDSIVIVLIQLKFA